jgi:hypothetical protein
MKLFVLFVLMSMFSLAQPLVQEQVCMSGSFQSRGLVVSPVKSGEGNADFTVQTTPMANDLFINVNGQHEGNYSVEVYDATGKLLNQARTRMISGNFSHKFSFSDYPGGIYMLKVTNEDAPASKLLRVIK